MLYTGSIIEILRILEMHGFVMLDFACFTGFTLFTLFTGLLGLLALLSLLGLLGLLGLPGHLVYSANLVQLVY